MQLFLNATSPFARVARVIALEKGLEDRVALVWSDPWNNDPALLATHPQLRIPVLVTDDGEAISESLLIAQYLDHIGHGVRLVPAQHMGAVLAQSSIAYGLMEAAFHVVIARKHDGDAADASVLGQRRLAAIDRALQCLEIALPAPLKPDITLDQIMTAVALEYVGFRLPALWPTDRSPQLHEWLICARQRASIASTHFQ
jgi:glutathione S-transferase